MSKYLVTGGAGFIGSALAHCLIENGNIVTIIDNLSTGFKENIPDNAIFIEGDCQDYKMMYFQYYNLHYLHLIQYVILC